MAYDNGNSWPRDDSEEGDGRPTVVVASAVPLELRTGTVDHPSIPDGAVGLGTYVEDRLLSRQAMSLDTIPTYQALLAVPRRLAYVAYDKDGAVEGQLVALVNPSEIASLGGEVADGGDETEDEPWKRSVPSFDPGGNGGNGGRRSSPSVEEPDDEDHVALLPLGVVVRLSQRRVHPDDLAAEAADVLRSVVNEGTIEIVDQFLDTI